MKPPLISCVVPTIGRPELHQQLYEGFAADVWPNKELVVLDEGPEASPFFSGLGDARVRYVHEPHPKTETNRIGAARNRLVALSRGDFIAHRDDDDWYSPDWLSFAMQRLGGADLLKLDVYRIITDSEPALIFEWDTRKFGGEHYALMGEEIKKTEVDPEKMPPEVVAMFRDGYGYSLIGPRRTFERFPFPEEGTEDFPFVRAVRAAGCAIKFVSDAAHMILHLVSKRSKSGVFPQKLVGTAGAPPVEALRAHVARKMVGLLGAMQELAPNKPIRVKPGVEYSVVASIKDTNTLKSIATSASKWGVHIHDAREVEPNEFGVNPPPPGYRLMHVTATVDHDTEMPWEVPSPLSAFDQSRVVRAWSSAPAGLGQAPDALCSEMMQLGDGSWSQVTTGSCVDVLADAAYRASNQPSVVLAVWTWNAVTGVWTNPTYYNEPTTATGPGGPITTVSPPCTWTQLHDGQDVGIKKGYVYSGVASVSKNYSKADIVSAMGSTYTMLDYAEQGQRPGIPVDSNTSHRTVVATVLANNNADDLPWSSPWPTTIFSLVHIWESPPANACGAKPPVPLGTASNPFVVPALVVVGAAGAAAGGWWWLHRKRSKRVA